MARKRHQRVKAASSRKVKPTWERRPATTPASTSRNGRCEPEDGFATYESGSLYPASKYQRGYET